MPSDRALRTGNAIHRGVMRISGGRIGWRAFDMPVLELTTTGRRTGRPHRVLLTSPHQEGDDLVVVASKGGEDTHPAWFLNLVADPAVTVTTRQGEGRPMVARVAGPKERERLWPLVTGHYSGYASYQEKTDRQIPLVVLSPTG